MGPGILRAKGRATPNLGPGVFRVGRRGFHASRIGESSTSQAIVEVEWLTVRPEERDDQAEKAPCMLVDEARFGRNESRPSYQRMLPLVATVLAVVVKE